MQKNIFWIRKTIALSLIIGLCVTCSALPNQKVSAASLTYEDLSTWTSIGGGNWQVQPGNRTVYQTVNGSEFYFLSPEADVINRTIQGTITVDENQSDNDFIGFTLGYKATNDNYVFAWDRGGWGESGYGKELWRMDPTTGKTHLATDISVDESKGWVNGVTYDFRILYMENKIRVSINGETIFDVNGTFQPGKFGFFNCSQGQVTYGNVKSAPGSLTEVVPVASNDSYGGDANTTITKNSSEGILSNDYDPNLDTFTVTVLDAVDHGTLNLNTSDGSFTYAPAEDFQGSDSFSYKLTDNDGDSNVATVTFNIMEPNVAPTDIVLSNTEVSSVAGNETVIGTLSTTDGNTNDAFDYMLLNSAGGRFGIDGNVISIANSTLITFGGSYTIQVRSTDLRGLYVDKNITITSVNHAPSDITFSDEAISEECLAGTVVGTLSATDPDTDQGDSVSLTLRDNAGGSFSLVNGNTIRVVSSESFNYTTPPSITVRATDSLGLYRDKTFTITLNEADAPVVSDLDITKNDPEETVIEWATDENAKAQLEYGINPSYGNTTDPTDGSDTDHAITIPQELLPCTNYDFRVKSTDAKNKTAVSSNQQITTANCIGNATVGAQNKGDVSENGGSVMIPQKVVLAVPEGFSSEASGANFQVKELDRSAVFTETDIPKENIKPVGNIYDMQAITGLADQITTFRKPLNITLYYTEDQVRNIDTKTLLIYTYHNAMWLPLSDCRFGTGSITCSTTHFSVFGLFGDPARSTSGKAKTIRQTGMSRANFRDTSIKTEVTPENFETMLEISRQEIAAMNEGVPKQVLTTINRWGEEVFSGYVPGKLSLDRFKARYQNPVAYRERPRPSGMARTTENTTMKPSASESLQDRIATAKSTYQNEIQAPEAKPKSEIKGLKKARAGDEVYSHITNRIYNEANPLPERKNTLTEVQESRVDTTKDMQTVQFRMGGKSFSMGDYLRNAQNSLIRVGKYLETSLINTSNFLKANLFWKW